MYDFIQNAVQPVIVEALLFVISGAILWVARFLPETLRMWIERNHRDALHRALDTAVGIVLDYIQKHPAVGIPDAAITRGLNYVYGSVPDALKRFAPTRERLEDMLRAKVRVELDRSLGRDRMTETLRGIGLDARKP